MNKNRKARSILLSVCVVCVLVLSMAGIAWADSNPPASGEGNVTITVDSNGLSVEANFEGTVSSPKPEMGKPEMPAMPDAIGCTPGDLPALPSSPEDLEAILTEMQKQGTDACQQLQGKCTESVQAGKDAIQKSQDSLCAGAKKCFATLTDMQQAFWQMAQEDMGGFEQSIEILWDLESEFQIEIK